MFKQLHTLMFQNEIIQNEVSLGGSPMIKVTLSPPLQGVLLWSCTIDSYVNIPVWEAPAFKYCIRASVTPARGHFLRSRCYFRTVKFYNHRGFPGKAAGGGGIPVTSWCLQTGSKVGDFFFWVWRLNNKQHWFVAATCWARTNVKIKVQSQYLSYYSAILLHIL